MFHVLLGQIVLRNPSLANNVTIVGHQQHYTTASTSLHRHVLSNQGASHSWFRSKPLGCEVIVFLHCFILHMSHASSRCRRQTGRTGVPCPANGLSLKGQHLKSADGLLRAELWTKGRRRYRLHHSTSSTGNA